MDSPVKINNSDHPKPKVLIAPLDWGLGHATRCIPIIKELLNQQCDVIAAVSGAQKALLTAEIPSLKFTVIPGYRVKYAKNRAFTILRIIVSIPKILISIKRENAWIRQFCAKEAPDLILSDNRYGLYVPGVVSVFITHQLRIQTPVSWVEGLVQAMNYRAIGKFSVCWVPDGEKVSLAGDLSHPKKMPRVPTRYIGWLSRMDAGGGQAERAGGGRNYLLVLLSGPEPQRSILERMICDQAKDAAKNIVVVRGLPDGGLVLEWPENVTVYDHLPAAELETIIRGAELVVCRSGYSTIMDLARLKKPAVLIPTPGQTEQEYLAVHLSSKSWALTVRQNELCLADILSHWEQTGALDGRCGQPAWPAPAWPAEEDDSQLLARAISEALVLAGFRIIEK